MGISDTDRIENIYNAKSEIHTIYSGRGALLFKLLGRRFHYKHVFNDLEKMTIVHNSWNPDDQVDVDLMKELFLECENMDKTEGKESSMRYQLEHDSYCDFTRQSRKHNE